jgi:hypothetical protein
MWPEPTDDARGVAWVRDLWQAMQPFSTGNIYVNYESDVGLDRVQAAYGPTKYARLVALKNAYDRTNFFRLNANIKPTV